MYVLASTVHIQDSICSRCGFPNLLRTYPPYSKELDAALSYAMERINKATRNVHERTLSSQRDAIHKIVKKESGGNPRAQNPRSTAYGSFQFLNSTWKGVGIKKTSCIGCQAEAGLYYILFRYKSPSRALDHHNRKGWY